MVKDKKQKGSNAERQLIKMFWEAGFAAMRAAGSGSARHPSPDLIASNGKITIAVECKSYSSDYIHLEYDQIVQLLEFSQKFGATPIVAVKFEGNDWYMLPMNKIMPTKGENFKVTKSFAEAEGKRFEQLIEELTFAQQ